eukprot:9466173-Pyramimonas_sp.AAC.2
MRECDGGEREHLAGRVGQEGGVRRDVGRGGGVGEWWAMIRRMLGSRLRIKEDNDEERRQAGNTPGLKRTTRRRELHTNTKKKKTCHHRVDDPLDGDLPHPLANVVEPP